MHIEEGFLSAPVLVAGGALAAVGIGIGLRRMDYERVPKVAVLSSAFFVASLIHLPVGPSSTHLILNGLMGIILGWAAFPALVVALLLQSIMFGFGGPTALGVNTVVMGLPAVICYYGFNRGLRHRSRGGAFALGFCAGALSIVLSGLLLATSLYLSGREFLPVIVAVLVPHVVVMLTEGLVTGGAVVFLRQVRPELLDAPLLVPKAEEVACA